MKYQFAILKKKTNRSQHQDKYKMLLYQVFEFLRKHIIELQCIDLTLLQLKCNKMHFQPD